VFKAVSTLFQFCFQLGGAIAAIIIIQSNLSANDIQANSSQFDLKIISLSSIGHFISLCSTQYLGLMIQHQDSLSFIQRFIYVLVCGLNSVAVMSACCLLFMMVSLSTYWFIASHQILYLVFFIGVLLIISAAVRFCMNLIGIECQSLDTICMPQSNQLQNVLKILGNMVNQVTSNMLIPPASVILHPLRKKFPMSPLTPTMFYAVLRHLIIMSLIMLLNIALLWSSTFAGNYILTKTVLVCIFTTVPAIFLSYLLLYIFYKYLDVFISNSLHLVFIQSGTEIGNPLIEAINEEELENFDEEYPENIKESLLSETAKTEEATENEKEMLTGQKSIKNRLKFSVIKKLNPDKTSCKISGNWVNTHLSI